MSRLKVLLATVLPFVLSHQALAQTSPSLSTIALKNGESIEVNDIWWAVNCRSILKDLPVAEILEGPPGVTVTVKEAMVVPRAQGCSQAVKGGKLVITAKDVEDYSTSKLTLRITSHTRDGDRQQSAAFNLTLFPKQE